MARASKAARRDFEAIESGLDTTQGFMCWGFPPTRRASRSAFMRWPFRNILARLFQHYEDLNMGQNYPWSVWRLLKETVSPKASDKLGSLLGGAVMRSIWPGLPYPAALYYAVINRIRAIRTAENVLQDQSIGWHHQSLPDPKISRSEK